MNNKLDDRYIAHRRMTDGGEQLLEVHLSEVGGIAGDLAGKIGVSAAGQLIGLLHDFGKFSSAFQNYIGSATGKINPDEDSFVDFKGLKGKIDHSSARPEGSMVVEKVIWWPHNCKLGQYSSARVHRTLSVNPEGSYSLENLEGLIPEEIDGF